MMTSRHSTPKLDLRNLAADTPVSSADQDQLRPGLRDLADRLAEILPDLPTSSPVLLSGDWGAGKTSLLRALEHRLKERGLGTVWFEAWRYEGEAALLSALLRRVWDSAPEEFHKNEDSKEILCTLLDVATMVSVRLLPGLLTAAGIPFVGKALERFTAKSMSDELEAASGAGTIVEPQVNPTDELWCRFDELLKSAWGEDHRVVIFLDDLDRCSPANALALLDAIRALLLRPEGMATPSSQGGCCFVLALDKGILAEAVARKFTDLGAYEGNRYLEKIFPLAFDLPSPDPKEVGFLVRSFLGPFPSGGNWDDRQDALRQTLENPVFANPRLMRRCICRFTLVVDFEEDHGGERTADSGTDAEAASDLALAKWIAATERWPALRRLFARETDDYWRRFGKALKPGDSSGTSLPDKASAELIEQPALKEWLIRELLGNEYQLSIYREAEHRLRVWGL